jgi:hypothetical protein
VLLRVNLLVPNAMPKLGHGFGPEHNVLVELGLYLPSRYPKARSMS